MTARAATPPPPSYAHLSRPFAVLARWYERRSAAPSWRRDAAPDRALRALARLYARLELPRAVAFLEALRVNRPELWQDAGIRECRGVWHGYRLRLDLADFYQRWAYFLSRYHEVPLQVLLRSALRPGDTFIDGGANLGLVSLVAGWLVGPRGRVFSFEPNPRAFEPLRWHVETNRLSQVTPLRQGLSDANETLVLQLPRWENIGAGTFCPLPERYGGVVADSCTAQTIRGDDLPGLPPTGELVIKLDVEGFEMRAIRGLARTIHERRPLLITEVNRELLIAADSSPFALFEHMHALGYHGYGFDTRRTVVRHRTPVLWRVPGPAPRMPRDIAWIHPESGAHKRLSGCFIDGRSRLGSGQ